MNLWLSLSTVEKSCARFVLIEIALFKPMSTMDTYILVHYLLSDYLIYL